MRPFIAMAASILVAAGLPAQNEGSSTLQGHLRDSHGNPVAAGTIELKISGQTFTERTDVQGTYRFQTLHPGTYTLHAVEAKNGEANFGPFLLGARESKTIDLTLESPQAQFFEQPTFIVAGVTDPSQRGGHGSDPVLRSAEVLARSTTALRTAASPADAAEAQGNALEAVREFQRAAQLNGTEDNVFNWGAELLKHRAADQAVEVFGNGARLFPHSTRMLLGLAVAFYSRGAYEQAAQKFFEACDLNPNDPAPYLFLGSVSSGAITDSAGYAARVERFASLQPENASANYYYAATLWKHRMPDDMATTAKVQSLLEKAVRLDPHLGVAFLQLGIVFADQNNFTEAIAAYQKAIDANPPMEEAHYRLALAYRRTGDAAKAKQEIELYQELQRQSAQAFERERAEVQQFVFALRGQSSGKDQ